MSLFENQLFHQKTLEEEMGRMISLHWWHYHQCSDHCIPLQYINIEANFFSLEDLGENSPSL